MSMRKATWTATWRRMKTRMVPGGEHRVTVFLAVDTPEAQAGRPIEVTLSADMARHLADRLYRNADEAGERNRRRNKAEQDGG